MYHKIVNYNKPTQSYKDKTIAAAKDLKALKKHPGWKLIEEFVNKQREGQDAHMQRDVQLRNASLIGFINSFFKHMYFLQENRAYFKIDNYIRVTIENGEKYAEEKAKETKPTG